MRVILAASIVAVVAACGSAPVNRGASVAATPASATGASTSLAAVESFFGGLKEGDVQAVAEVWGSRKGPALQTVAGNQLEDRIHTMRICLGADSMRVLSTPLRKRDSVFYKVQLKKGGLVGETDVTTVVGPHDRWYVADARIEPIVPMCRTGLR